MEKKFKNCERLQLFNAFHYKEVVELLNGASPLELGSEKSTDSIDQINSTDILKDVEEYEEPNLPDSPSKSSEVGQSCTTCGITFSTLKEQRQHFHLDWHRYNLKRKIHKQAAVSEEEFDEMMDGLSSISGSDGEDTVEVDNALSRLVEKFVVTDAEERNVNPGNNIKRVTKMEPKLYFTTTNNQVFAVYKALFPTALAQPGESLDDVNLRSLRQMVQNHPTWAVVMVSGGHFAASIFNGYNDVVHKTIHRYTVRAKQGGSQGSKDSKGSHAKSAGANLRRYNEQAFNQNVQEVLASWKEKLNQCKLIFYRAVSFNNNILFGGQNPPLLKSDVRLKTIPFQTKRPTFSETKRVVSLLATVNVYDSTDEFKAMFLAPEKVKSSASKENNSRSKSKKIDRAKSRSPVKRDEPDKPPSSPEVGSDTEFVLNEAEETIDTRDALQEFGVSFGEDKTKKKSKPKKSKTKVDDFPKPGGTLGEAFQAVTEKNETGAKECISKLREEFANDPNLWNQPLDSNSLTLLHHTCKNDLKELVWLLLECGCDPGLKDKTGKYPYNWAQTKDCRKTFMRFQAEFPDKYDYSKAQIPGPLTKEMEEEKANKQKMLNKIKREKEKLKKMEKKEKQQEEDERTRFLNLSDREKRALAAERRLLGQAKRNGETAPILVRCFDCATDITGKVPFEYNQNVFCSTKCLAIHRKKFPTPLSL